MGFMPGEYPMWLTKERMIAECRFAPTIFLGDSRANAAFVPSRIPDSTNLSLGGATRSR